MDRSRRYTFCWYRRSVKSSRSLPTQRYWSRSTTNSTSTLKEGGSWLLNSRIICDLWITTSAWSRPREPGPASRDICKLVLNKAVCKPRAEKADVSNSRLSTFTFTFLSFGLIASDCLARLGVLHWCSSSNQLKHWRRSMFELKRLQMRVCTDGTDWAKCSLSSW